MRIAPMLALTAVLAFPSGAAAQSSLEVARKEILGLEAQMAARYDRGARATLKAAMDKRGVGFSQTHLDAWPNWIYFFWSENARDIYKNAERELWDYGIALKQRPVPAGADVAVANGMLVFRQIHEQARSLMERYVDAVARRGVELDKERAGQPFDDAQLKREAAELEAALKALRDRRPLFALPAPSEETTAPAPPRPRPAPAPSPAPPARDPQPTALRFEERDGTGSKPLAALQAGRAFFIRATYSSAPAADETAATLSWKGAEPKPIALRRDPQRRDQFVAGPFVARVAADPASRPLPAATPVGAAPPGTASPLEFLSGRWRVTYEDRHLGQVSGVALVSALSDNAGFVVRYTVVNPRTGERSEMVANEMRRADDRLEILLVGWMPSAAATAEGDTANAASAATTIDVPPAVNLDAAIDRVRASAKLDPDAAAPASVLLRFPLGGDAAARLGGTWTVRRDRQTGFKNLRTGARGNDAQWKDEFESNAEVMTGAEAWVREGPRIDSVTTAEMEPFGRFAGVDPAYWAKRDALTTAWLRVTGRDLPSGAEGSVQVTFDDAHVRHVGSRPDPQVAGAIQIEVELHKAIRPGPKPLLLNGAPGTWAFDFPALEPREIRHVRPIRDGEYDPTPVLYVGEAFHVEVEFPYAPFYDKRRFMTLLDSVEPLSFDVTRTTDRRNVFRSPRLLVVDREAPPADIKLPSIRAWDGARLVTTAGDVRVPGSNPPVGVVNITDAADGRYRKALDFATEVRKAYPDSSHYNVSVRIITDKLKKRTTHISVQDHAALILLHEEMQKSVDAASMELTRSLPRTLTRDDPTIDRYWSGEKKRLVDALVARAQKFDDDHPLLITKVASPDGERIMVLDEALRDALREGTFSGPPAERERAFRRYATWAVIDAERQLAVKMNDAVAALHRADPRRPLELLPFARMGYARIAPVLMQELVRPADPAEGDPPYPRWVPDLPGRAAVRGLSDLVEAIQTEEAYATVDKHVVVMLAAAATLGLSGVGAAANYVGRSAVGSFLEWASVGGAAGLTAADVGLFANDFHTYLARSLDADRALGASPVTGLDAYHAYRAEASAAAFGAAMAGAANVGLPAFMYAAEKLLRPSRAAVDNALFLAERRGVDSLSDANRNVLEYARGAAEYRARTQGAGALTEIDRRALRAAYPDGVPESLAKTWKMTPGDTTLPPVRPDPPTNAIPRADPRAETASVPRLSPDVESRALSHTTDTNRGPRIDLRDAAPENSTSTFMRDLYADAAAAARRGDTRAPARQARLESAEALRQGLNDTQKGRVDEAWEILSRLRQSNKRVAEIDPAEAASMLMLQARRERAQAVPGSPSPIDPDEMAAIVAAWNRKPVTPQELARAANTSVPNAQAAIDSARRLVDRFESGPTRAASPPPAPVRRGSPTVTLPPSRPPKESFTQRVDNIAGRLRQMGVPADDAQRAAFAPAGSSLDADVAVAGAAMSRNVPAQSVMKTLNVTREQLADMLNRYQRHAGGGGPPTARARAIDDYLDGTGRVTVNVPPPAPDRVTRPVPGLYQGISTAESPAPGWRFEDGPRMSIDGGAGFMTRITAPDGTTGNVLRTYNASTGELVLQQAFLDEFRGSPHRWIQAGPGLVEGRGTPLVTFATLRQMQLLGVPYGGLKRAKISLIVNTEAAIQMEALTRNGMSAADAALRTHSWQYAETALVQSGHQLVPNSVRVNPGIKKKLASLFVGESEIQLRHYRDVMSRYGLKETDDVEYGFEIVVDLQRADAATVR